MAEKITAENFLNNLVETVADSVSKKKSVSFFEEETSSVTSRFNRLFGRQKPVHHLLGGGKSADVLLWRNKKISASVLTAATAIWILFEWLNYHFLTLVCLALVLGMLAQFVWMNASGLFNRSPSEVPRLKIPNDIFVSIGRTVGAEVNNALQFLQDISSGGNLKQFLLGLAAKQIVGKRHEYEGLYIFDTKVPRSIACSGVVNSFDKHCLFLANFSLKIMSCANCTNSFVVRSSPSVY